MRQDQGKAPLPIRILRSVLGLLPLGRRNLAFDGKGNAIGTWYP